MQFSLLDHEPVNGDTVVWVPYHDEAGNCVGWGDMPKAQTDGAKVAVPTRWFPLRQGTRDGIPVVYSAYNAVMFIGRTAADLYRWLDSWKMVEVTPRHYVPVEL